jgi:virginiamycin B lyase
MFGGVQAVVSRAVRIAALLSVVASLFAILTAGASAAAPGEVTSFRVPSPCYGTNIAAAPREGVLLRQCENPESNSGRAAIGALLPSGQILEAATIDAPEGPLLAGPEDEIWVAANKLGSTEAISIDRIDPDGNVRIFDVPNSDRELVPIVHALTLGPEGSLWAAVGEGEKSIGTYFGSFGGELVRISPDGAIDAFPLPHQIEPLGIALGSDGNLWFTGVFGRKDGEHEHDAGVGFIGRMTPAGELSLFRTPARRASPEAIATGPDGRLWFVEGRIGKIGTIDVRGNFGRRYEVRPISAGPEGLALGPDGNMWTSAGGLMRLTPTGQQTFFRVGYGPPVVGAEGGHLE